MAKKEMITLTINNKEITCEKGTTILKAAESAGIYIPRLCFLEGIHEESSCRVCVVEIEGYNTLKNSCKITAEDGMVVRTNTDRVKKSVKTNLQLTAANHTFECWVCPREHNCEFLDLLRRNNIANPMGESEKYAKKERIYNLGSPAIELDSGKCTLCGRCISACKTQAGTHVLDFNNRGSETVVGTSQGECMEDAGCIYCGKCLQACPVAAIREKSELEKVEEVLADPTKFVTIQAAPAVRAALGEEFGFAIGTNTEGKMYHAMKLLGFDEICDTNFGADLTIMEEGHEFIKRFKENGPFPMFTSCSPGWIRKIETYYPEFLDNLSSCKSPTQMAGATIKHYLAPKLGQDPKNVVNVSVMPCIAKKSEAAREEMEHDNIRDIDIVLTTREFARLIKLHDIDFSHLKDYKPEGELAQFTGAGAIFGATGGVMEAALRTVADELEGQPIDTIDYKEVRGVKDIKEATLNIAGSEVNIAVVHGGVAIDKFMEILKEGKKTYHFVEFMGCTGGCVNGGGQPIVTAKVQDSIDVRATRAKALYNQDKKMKLRKSHHSPSIKTVYETFYKEPGSKLAHDLLHTTYKKKDIYTSVNKK